MKLEVFIDQIYKMSKKHKIESNRVVTLIHYQENKQYLRGNISNCDDYEHHLQVIDRYLELYNKK